MKKNGITIPIMMVVILMATIFMIGCGKKENKKTEIIEETIEEENINNKEESPSKKEIPKSELYKYILDLEGLKQSKGKYISSEYINEEYIPDEFKDIGMSVYQSIPKIELMTQSDLFSFSTTQFRAFICLYAPDYRSLYIISDDLVMDETHWNTLRQLVSYDIFQDMHNPNIVQPEQNQEEYEKNMRKIINQAEDIIYNDMDIDKNIKSLEEQIEILERLNDIEVKDYLTDSLKAAGYINSDGSEIDLSELTVEEIKTIKEQIIEELKESIEDYKEMK